LFIVVDHYKVLYIKKGKLVFFH